MMRSSSNTCSWTSDVSWSALMATWSSAYITALPDSAFACIDSEGRHYPHHNSSGALDLPHLRAALSRLGDASNTQCGKGHIRHLHARGAEICGSTPPSPSLVRRASSGEIEVWPFIEQTLSTSPVN